MNNILHDNTGHRVVVFEPFGMAKICRKEEGNRRILLCGSLGIYGMTSIDPIVLCACM